MTGYRNAFPRKQPVKRVHQPRAYKAPVTRTQIGLIVSPTYLVAVDTAAKGRGLSRAAWMRYALCRELAGDHDEVQPQTWPQARGRLGRCPVNTQLDPGLLARLILGTKLRGVTRAALLRYALDRELAGANTA